MNLLKNINNIYSDAIILYARCQMPVKQKRLKKVTWWESVAWTMTVITVSLILLILTRVLSSFRLFIKALSFIAILLVLHHLYPLPCIFFIMTLIHNSPIVLQALSDLCPNFVFIVSSILSCIYKKFVSL